MKTLPYSFYDRDTVEVARDLLGKTLIRRMAEGLITAYISETEAYRSDDPACHAYKGKTPRNAGLFGPVGHTYVYFCYGIHHCVNIVSRDGIAYPAGGVLIRGVTVLTGQDIIEKYTGKKKDLIAGPGNVAKALALHLGHGGIDVTNEHSELFIRQSELAERLHITATQRIGISKGIDKLWRFELCPSILENKK